MLSYCVPQCRNPYGRHTFPTNFKDRELKESAGRWSGWIAAVKREKWTVEHFPFVAQPSAAVMLNSQSPFHTEHQKFLEKKKIITTNKNNAIAAETCRIGTERLFWPTSDLRFSQLILPLHFRSSELPVNKFKKAISV